MLKVIGDEPQKRNTQYWIEHLSPRSEAIMANSLDILDNCPGCLNCHFGPLGWGRVSFRIGGQRQWLPVIGNGALFSGVSGLDHWKPSFAMEGVEHSLCNAHHLRALQALVDIEGAAWARRLQELLRRASRAARIAVDKDIAVPARLVALVFHESPPPFSSGKGKKRRIGHNPALRLGDHKTAVRRFLTDPEVGFTNNEAARDLRRMKRRQKMSGGFRAAQGAENFTLLRSSIATARKQGWNIIETLMSTSDRLSANVKCA